MGSFAELLALDFATLPDLIRAHGRERPDRRALVQDADTLTYAELDALLDRIAAALQRHHVAAGTPVCIIASTTVSSAALFLGALRAGCAPAPIAPTSTPEQIATMVADSGAQIVFIDDEAGLDPAILSAPAVRIEALEDWLGSDAAEPITINAGPDDPFNVIYSSGTTGTPKGIVHNNAMRWTQIKAYADAAFSSAVTLVATPLYSNTTLVSLLPTLAYGGTAVLLGKFDARRFLEVAERERVTHAMLVPVQYQRIMATPDFDRYDLSSFLFKSCTSAPFSAELKRDVVTRWPGLLVEIYGMTEGGGTCLLYANVYPDKLHTVGQPAPGNDIRLIDDVGREVPKGTIGEVVGRSGVMMAGYHGRDDETKAATWFDAEGRAYIRHGDLGRFDDEGFLTLLGRSKDMIISGGFNIYPPDLESVLISHPDVLDAAVVGVPSEAWGETPYAFFVASRPIEADALIAWVNSRVGKTQRLSGAEPIDQLPRSPIGKVLKRELRTRFATGPLQETGMHA